jgi:hypothetical protein
MKNKKLNAVQVWKQLEDLAVPRLHLSVFERAVYSHLLRHSRLEGGCNFAFPFRGSLAAHAFPFGPHAERCGAWWQKVRCG